MYYEARLAKVELPQEARAVLDTGFEEVTELAETETRERMKTRWARVEAIVGAEKRIAEVAADMAQDSYSYGEPQGSGAGSPVDSEMIKGGQLVLVSGLGIDP